MTDAERIADLEALVEKVAGIATTLSLECQYADDVSKSKAFAAVAKIDALLRAAKLTRYPAKFVRSA